MRSHLGPTFRMLERRIAHAIFCGALLSCNTAAVRGDLSSAPPVAALHVRLGLRAGQLTITRPNAIFAPYTGFEERIGNDYVSYRFANTEYKIPAGARLSQVAISHGVTDNMAETELAAAASSIGVRVGPPSRCGVVKRALSTGRVIIWDRNNEELIASLWLEGDSTRFTVVLRAASQPTTISEPSNCSLFPSSNPIRSRASAER